MPPTLLQTSQLTSKSVKVTVVDSCRGQGGSRRGGELGPHLHVARSSSTFMKEMNASCGVA
jgi:hypothetical protein